MRGEPSPFIARGSVCSFIVCLDSRDLWGQAEVIESTPEVPQ